jgi:anti-sigma regulatory factor (Ser/Thr protein kinase)
MLRKTNRLLFIKIPVEEAFLRLAPMFVGQGAVGLGLDAEAAEELSLAAEEIMAYLVRAGSRGGEVEIRCFAGSHYVQAVFSFSLENLGLRAFNMTATVNLDEEAGMDEMELLIASRMADKFRIARGSNGNPELTLIKEFSYPEISGELVGEVQPLSRFTLAEPDAGQIKWFLRQVHTFCHVSVFPRNFLFPGKIVDMAAAGDFQLLVAVGPAGEIGGGIAWKWEGDKTVELFGPYIFHDKTGPEMARELMDGCISRVARSSALVLINRMPPPELPDGYLEPLGTISMAGADGVPQRITAYFREIHEDMGAVSWVHADLLDFLEKEYGRLYFPREIREITADGETDEPFSVLSAEVDRRLGRATLRPIWPGVDRLENLKNHLNMLQHEGLDTALFEMDLGVSWQAEFAPALLQLGFSPQILLPHAGSGDLLIFELSCQVP